MKPNRMMRGPMSVVAINSIFWLASRMHRGHPP